MKPEYAGVSHDDLVNVGVVPGIIGAKKAVETPAAMCRQCVPRSGGVEEILEDHVAIA
jgi:hypothetical protein